jgi:hypothetical protein
VPFTPKTRYGYVWVCLGEPIEDIPDLPYEEDLWDRAIIEEDPDTGIDRPGRDREHRPQARDALPSDRPHMLMRKRSTRCSRRTGARGSALTVALRITENSPWRPLDCRPPMLPDEKWRVPIQLCVQG